jgi:hypothetical protein
MWPFKKKQPIPNQDFNLQDLFTKILIHQEKLLNDYPKLAQQIKIVIQNNGLLNKELKSLRQVSQNRLCKKCYGLLDFNHKGKYCHFCLGKIEYQKRYKNFNQELIIKKEPS